MHRVLCMLHFLQERLLEAQPAEDNPPAQESLEKGASGRAPGTCRSGTSR
jgi:hypothetical protein